MEDQDNHFESQGFEEMKRFPFPQESDSQTFALAPQSPHRAHRHTDDKSINADTASIEKLESGLLQYGCPHYRRRCRIRAPCCNEIFDCRHCHNEAKVDT